MSQYPECPHGNSDPNFPCEECKRDGLVKIAESIYDCDPMKELREEVEALKVENKEFRDDAKLLNWIQENFERCAFITEGEWPQFDLRSGIREAMEAKEQP